MKILHLDLDRAYAVGEAIALPPEELHHCRHVLRLAPGTRFQVSDGRSWRYEGEFHGNTVIVTQATAIPPLTRPLHLHVSPLVKDLSEGILRRATELGVSDVHWTLFKRSELLWQYDKVATRWERLMREAVKASGRERVPRVHAPKSFDSACVASGMHVVGSLEPGRVQVVQLDFPSQGEIHLWIGPTGDFTSDELSALKTWAIPVSLGRYVYRVEMAMTIATILIQQRLHEL